MTAEMYGPRYSARAAIRAEHYALMTRPAWITVADATGLGAQTRLLDIGCGSGEFCRIAADRGAEVSGLDAAEGMIALARRLVPDGDFRLGSLEQLPWGDGVFDVVTAFNSLQLAEDMVAALAEARRVTVAGGQVAVCNWGPRKDRELLVVAEAIRALQPPGPAVVRPAFGDPGVLEDLARQAGLTLGASGLIDVPYETPDLATLRRAMLAGGEAQPAIAYAGEAAVGQAITEAAAPFRRADGSYRFENVFRYLITHN